MNDERIESFRKAVLNSTDPVRTCLSYLSLDGSSGDRYYVRLPPESEGLLEAIVSRYLGGKRESTAHILRFLITVGILCLTEADDDLIAGIRADMEATSRRELDAADQKRLTQIEGISRDTLDPDLVLEEVTRLHDRARTASLRNRALTQMDILKGRI